MQPIKLHISAIYLSLLLLSLSACDQTDIPLSPMRLQDLASGIPLHKRERLRVADIRVGGMSIKDLFMEADVNDVSTAGYYLGFDEDITIRLKDHGALDELRSLLLRRGQKPIIVVYLEDPKRGWLRLLHEKFDFALPSVTFRSRVIIPIFDPCVQLTQIVYTGIDSIISEKIRREGQSDTSMSLESIFGILLKNDVEEFMNTLAPVDKNNTCLSTMELLKWIRNEDVHGFEYEQYKLNPELKTILATITESLSRVQKWDLYHFNIEVIGYTDSEPVEAITLDKAKTGVGSLEKANIPLRVYFGRCSGDHLRGEPLFFGLLATKGSIVRSPLKSNCELGAVRAYVATAFMAEGLSGQGVEYKYATGGVSEIVADKDDKLKRKVDIRITVKAAKAENRNVFSSPNN